MRREEKKQRRGREDIYIYIEREGEREGERERERERLLFPPKVSRRTFIFPLA